MVTLPLDELKEREAVVDALGEEVIVNGRANGIFALSNEKYHDKYKDTISDIKEGQFTGGSKK